MNSDNITIIFISLGFVFVFWYTSRKVRSALKTGKFENIWKNIGIVETSKKEYYDRSLNPFLYWFAVLGSILSLLIIIALFLLLFQI